MFFQLCFLLILHGALSVPKCDPVSEITIKIEDNKCVDNCPDNCLDLVNPAPKACILMCQREGCQCAPGYVREKDGGKCIKNEDCGITPDSWLKNNNCSPNEKAVHCKTCASTCENLVKGTRQRPCPRICRMGCDCKNGYKRINDSPGSPCVKESECEKIVKNL